MLFKVQTHWMICWCLDCAFLLMEHICLKSCLEWSKTRSQTGWTVYMYCILLMICDFSTRHNPQSTSRPQSTYWSPLLYPFNMFLPYSEVSVFASIRSSCLCAQLICYQQGVCFCTHTHTHRLYD